MVICSPVYTWHVFNFYTFCDVRSVLFIAEIINTKGLFQRRAATKVPVKLYVRFFHTDNVKFCNSVIVKQALNHTVRIPENIQF